MAMLAGELDIEPLEAVLLRECYGQEWSPDAAAGT